MAEDRWLVIPSDRFWTKQAGASKESLLRLREAAPIELPAKYYDLLAFSDGGEGPLRTQPLWFQLYSVDYAVEMFGRGLNDEFFSGFLFFGSSGGGEGIAFDARKPGLLPIVSIDWIDADLNESVWLVAPDFDAFLDLVGLE
jgi:hypothetical protein